MQMPETPPRYHAYLLRCWEERTGSPDSSTTWRFAVEKVGGGERHGFATLEAVLAFLRRQLARTERQSS